MATSEPKHIHASAADLLHIRIENLEWCKCDCLCCRNRLSLLQRNGCNAYCFGFNAGTRGKNLTIQLLWAAAQLLVTSVSFICLVDEFCFLLLLNETSTLGKSVVLLFLFLVLIRWNEEGR